MDDVHFLLHRSIELITVPDKAVDGSSVFSLPLQSGCSAYDCEFVRLARDLGLSLVTVNKKVLNAFSDLAVLPEIYLSGMS